MQDVNIVLGSAYYAQGQFEKSLNLWCNALHTMKKSKTNQKDAMAELMNNIGCIYFELGTEVKALKFMKQSLQVQLQEILHSVHEKGGRLYRHALIKLATTRANIAYIHLRMKNADQAISQFEESLTDQKLCLDPHHPFVVSTMDHLAISYVRKGEKDKAIQIYSKMLTAQIEADGAEHQECIAILTKLSVLQLKGRDKAGIRSCMKKIQSSTRENGACQKERFEKLLKVHKVPGLKPISIRKTYS
jgi:tetratricopeptide (TPR) repeat protein